MSTKNFKRLDWEAIAALASHNNVIEIAASEEDDPLTLREVTAEQLLEVLEETGASIEIQRDEETGEINEIHASCKTPLTQGDVDTVLGSLRASGTSRLPFILLDGMQGILDRIEATGPTPAKILGDLAQTSVDASPISTTGTFTSGSTSVTVASPTGIVVGQSVAGPGIAPGTDVAVIAGSAVTLSQQTTAAGAAGTPLTFTTETQVIGLAEWTLSWKRKTADATTTDDDTYESSLGSTASWSVKAKYMFIDGDTSQSTNILATITTPQSPTTWNFFPTIGTGRAAFSGAAYVDGIDIATGMGKVVGLDVSLKGTGKLNFLTQAAPIPNPNTGTGQQAED
jgi:hypothetical protein